MMRARYIRFREGVQTPGRAGAQISKAVVGASETSQTPIDERMAEILVGPDWILLRAVRKGPDGKPYMAERVTHASNVRDFEPDEPAEDPKARKAAPKET